METRGEPKQLQYIGVLTVKAECTFVQAQAPNQVNWSRSGNITNITGTSATVTWYGSQLGTGWVTYNDSNGEQFNQTAQSVQVGHLVRYFAQLHGLDPWGTYNVTAHVKVTKGCYQPLDSYGLLPLTISIVYTNSTAPLWFSTAAIAPLTEQDYPYDSISNQGGGAALYWQVPAGFVAQSSFLNGSVTLTNVTNPTNSVVVPLYPPLSGAQVAPPAWYGGPTNTTFVVNLTGMSLNTAYNVSVELNYSIVRGPMAGRTITGVGIPLVFTYEKDTSGDGLTDWEKVYGWNATTQNAWGATSVTHVTANPNLFATNGLTSDYVEKEFGLNPGTVDTAGSHMLDTWNLTFDLGVNSSNPTLPAGLDVRTWNELGNYNWAQACQVLCLP